MEKNRLPFIKEVLIEMIKKEKIRINIQGSWASIDMANLFGSLTKLYRFHLHLNFMLAIFNEYKYSGVKYEHYSHISSNLNTYFERMLLSFDDNFSVHIENELIINKVEFASPGFTDLSGVGKIIEQIKEIIFHYFPNERERIEIDLLIQERNSLIIKNLKEIGVDPHIMQQLFLKENEQLNKIASLIENDKIKSIE